MLCAVSRRALNRVFCFFRYRLKTTRMQRLLSWSASLSKLVFFMCVTPVGLVPPFPPAARHKHRGRDVKRGKQSEVLWVCPGTKRKTRQDCRARAGFYEWTGFFFFFVFSSLSFFCEWKTTGKSSRKSPQRCRELIGGCGAKLRPRLLGARAPGFPIGSQGEPRLHS